MPTSMTPEQQKLREDLIAEYGESVCAQAYELSGLTQCLIVLGADDLASEERERAFHHASRHVSELLGMLMDCKQTVAVTECAKRIDAALELWFADQIEARDGLPPSNPLDYNSG